MKYPIGHVLVFKPLEPDVIVTLERVKIVSEETTCHLFGLAVPSYEVETLGKTVLPHNVSKQELHMIGQQLQHYFGVAEYLEKTKSAYCTVFAMLNGNKIDEDTVTIQYVYGLHFEMLLGVLRDKSLYRQLCEVELNPPANAVSAMFKVFDMEWQDPGMSIDATLIEYGILDPQSEDAEWHHEGKERIVDDVAKSL